MTWAPESSRRRLRRGIPGTAVPTEALPVSPLRQSSFNASADRDRLVVSFLGETKAFPLPMDWRAQIDAQDRLLWKMNLHYMEYLPTLEDELFVELIESWIRSVPPYARPRDPAWLSYTVATRIPVWIGEMRRRRTRLERPFQELYSRSLYEQLRYLRRNLELDVRGNHLIRNIRALAWGSRTFHGSEAREWGETAWKLLSREIPEQVLADGVHFERSPAYHAQVVGDLIEVHHLLEDDGRRSELFPLIESMMRAMSDLIGRDGRRALFNDGGVDTGPSWTALQAAWRYSGGGEPADRRSFAQPEAGFFGVRSDELYIVLKGGPIGADHLPAHAHGDIFSFELTLAGRPVIVDSGTYQYAPGPMRDYARSTAAHNTVTVDGRDQAEFWRNFRVARRYPPEDVSFRATSRSMLFEGTFKGYRSLIGDGIEHTRTVRWRREGSILLVDDEIRGRGRHLVESRLHLHPDVSVERRDDRIRLLRDGVHVEMHVNHGAVRIEESWYSPRMGARLPRPVIVVFDEAALPLRLEYALEY